MLHEVVVTYHPMGFICSWEERLVAWADGMPRNKDAFGNSGIPLASNFFTPVNLVRDDVRYLCRCSTNTCSQQDDASQCLDPANPTGGPVPCACLNPATAEGC
jgi:hypothetical protein